jgi:hypothetical protein
MCNIQQTKTIDAIRELTLDEVQTVSGGGDDGDFDGGGPLPDCNPLHAV